MLFLIHQLPLLIITCLYLNKIYLQWTRTNNVDFKGIFHHYFLKPSLIIIGLSFISAVLFSYSGFRMFPFIQYLIASLIALYLAIGGFTYVFGRFAQKKQSLATILNYGLSILIMTMFISFMAHDHFNYAFYEEPIFVLEIAFSLSGLCVALISAICLNVGFKIFYFFGRKDRHQNQSFNIFKKNEKNIHKTSKDMKEHYQAHGLNAQEIDYFREQMAQAKIQIQSIEREFPQTAKLRAIETRHNTIRVIQSFFKDIVNQPKRLTDVGQFLYKFLPSLQDLLVKYNEISQHIAKNKQTYQILDKTALTIDQLCQQITDEYILFHKNTFDELNDEIKLANRNIQRRQHRDDSTQTGDDLLDQLIQDEDNKDWEDQIDE